MQFISKKQWCTLLKMCF